jgi:hypothetical protein
VNLRAAVRLEGLSKLEKIKLPHRGSNPRPSGSTTYAAAYMYICTSYTFSLRNCITIANVVYFPSILMIIWVIPGIIIIVIVITQTALFCVFVIFVVSFYVLVPTF